jgi:hypothetical protein
MNLMLNDDTDRISVSPRKSDAAIIENNPIPVPEESITHIRKRITYIDKLRQGLIVQTPLRRRVIAALITSLANAKFERAGKGHPLLEKRMRRFGYIVLPFVLIGLGVYILARAFLL